MSAACKTSSRLAIGLICAVLLVSLRAGDVAAEPNSYALMCRGGSLMSFRVLKPEGSVTMKVTFRRSPTAGSVSPPGPGTCAWIDRPIRRGEPNIFQIVAPGPLSVECGYTSGVERCVLRNLPARLWQIRKDIRRNRPFEVRVYNNGDGVFIVNPVRR